MMLRLIAIKRIPIRIKVKMDSIVSSMSGFDVDWTENDEDEVNGILEEMSNIINR